MRAALAGAAASALATARLFGAMRPELPPSEPDPVIEAYKKHVDRTVIRENLKLTHSQRVDRLIELQRFAEGLRRAGDELRRRERQGHG